MKQQYTTFYSLKNVKYRPRQNKYIHPDGQLPGKEEMMKTDPPKK